MLFHRHKIKKEMIRMLRPTSKATLKTQCLLISNGDIDKAQKLYDFYAKDMPDMPLYDAPQPTWLDNTKSTLTDMFGFLGDHKDEILQGWEMIRGLFGRTAEDTADAVEDVAADLPPINE